MRLKLPRALKIVFCVVGIIVLLGGLALKGVYLYSYLNRNQTFEETIQPGQCFGLQISPDQIKGSFKSSHPISVYYSQSMSTTNGYLDTSGMDVIALDNTSGKFDLKAKNPMFGSYLYFINRNLYIVDLEVELELENEIDHAAYLCLIPGIVLFIMGAIFSTIGFLAKSKIKTPNIPTNIPNAYPSQPPACCYPTNQDYNDEIMK